MTVPLNFQKQAFTDALQNKCTNFSIFTGKHLQLLKSEGPKLYEKETPSQVFSGEYCENFKNIFLIIY